MTPDDMTYSRAKALEEELAKFGINRDFYQCCAAVMLNKVPSDVTYEQRQAAKMAMYTYGVSRAQ